MIEELMFLRKNTTMEIGTFDKDKEIRISIDDEDYSNMTSTYITVDQVQELIIHLAECLKEINEPIELLTKLNK